MSGTVVVFVVCSKVLCDDKKKISLCDNFGNFSFTSKRVPHEKILVVTVDLVLATTFTPTVGCSGGGTFRFLFGLNICNKKSIKSL